MCIHTRICSVSKQRRIVVELDAEAAQMAAVRARRLFAALDKARNTQPVGRLNRQEIYDRPVLRGH